MADEIGGIKPYEDDINEEYGVEIKGQDLIYLNAEKIRSPVELSTEAQDFAGAINELFSLDPGGGDDWQVPSWWSLPDPTNKQIVALVDTALGNTIEMCLYGYDGAEADYGGTALINWGDGTTTIIPAGSATVSGSGGTEHIYTVQGKYIITVTGTTGTETQRNCIDIKIGGSYGKPFVAIKTGMGIMYTNNWFYSMPNLAYISFTEDVKAKNGESACYFSSDAVLRKVDLSAYPTMLKDAAFSGCYALTDCDICKNCEVIPSVCFGGSYNLSKVTLTNATTIKSGAFSGCISLKKLSLPIITTLEDGALDYMQGLEELDAPMLTSLGNNLRNSPLLRKVNTPLLTSCGQYAFEAAYSLTDFTYAAGCNFNGNTFAACTQLQNKPT